MLALGEVGKAIAYQVKLFCFHSIKLPIFNSRNYTLNKA
jgi:hypothetical protein